MTLKMEAGAISQGMQVVFRTWKRQGKRFSLTPQDFQRVLPVPSDGGGGYHQYPVMGLDFSPVRPVSEF